MDNHFGSYIIKTKLNNELILSHTPNIFNVSVTCNQRYIIVSVCSLEK